MSAMNKEYTAVARHRGDWWIGWIEEVPGVNCQERTREQLLDSLRVNPARNSRIQSPTGHRGGGQ